MTHSTRHTLPDLRLVAALVLAALVGTNIGVARASVEIIPSVGVTKSTDDNAGDAQGFGGLAIRFPLMSFLKAEGGFGYRQDSFAGGDLKVHQWPITASLWASPFPNLYAGGGLGWYRTSFEYSGALAFNDETTQSMGIHLGGGATLPMTSQLGLDLNGRYIFMQDEDNLQIPTTFNPDFWTLALGLAIKF
jgi:opacity protein-like surface antigen